MVSLLSRVRAGNLPQRDGAAAAAAREAALQTRVDGLIYAYCSLGHTIARVDPLAETLPQNPLLSLREFGSASRTSTFAFHQNSSSTIGP
jgi:2-oxoglutarate dehydrogenase complex dehydrogenase (E1) component-like enzyme